MREIKTQNLSEIAMEICNLKDSEVPIVIRDGLDIFNLDEWQSFLSTQCELKKDTRHFTRDEKLRIQDWWEISYQPELASTYAYSKTDQPLHTDNAWFSDPAEINFFAMEKQSPDGGAQTIYPISNILNDLKKVDPDLLKDLITTEVIIKKGDTEYFNRSPIIDCSSRKPRIYWNFYRVEKSDPFIESLCERFHHFLQKQIRENNVDRILCKSGDCFAFNDTLLLHGRDSFLANQPRDRVLYQSMWRYKN